MAFKLPLRQRLRLCAGLAAALGAAAAHPPSAMAQTQTAERATETVSGERIALLARDRVRTDLEAIGSRGDVIVSQLPPDAVVPGGNATLRIREPLDLEGRDDGTATRHLSVQVDIYAAQHWIRSTTVRLDLVPADVGASASPVRKREAPTPPAPTTTGQTTLERSKRPPDGIAAALPRDARPAESSVRPASGSEHRPLVRRGQYVVLRVADGPIRMESHGQALDDGLAGQEIRVKLASSTDAIVATVTGAGQLEVRP